MGYALCRGPPTIAHCFKILDSWHFCKRIFWHLLPELVIWHAWYLHFGVLGDLGTILVIVEHKKGHLGEHHRKNHRKKYGTNDCYFRAIYGEMYLNNIVNGFLDFSASD